MNLRSANHPSMVPGRMLPGKAEVPNQADAAAQDLNPFLSKERVCLIAPDENKLYLYPPPFHTMKRVIEDKANFWTKFGALDQITPELCVDIGDFGIGSDTAIVLDYREGPRDPKVIRLQ